MSDLIVEKGVISKNHTIDSPYTLDCAETGRVIATFYNEYDLDAVVSMQAEINKLKADNKQWEEMHKSSLYGNIGEIKAQGIEEALSTVGCPYGDDTIGLHDWLEDYASSLRDKGSD